MNNQQSILDFQRLADKLTTPSKLDYWSNKADELAMKSGKQMVVIRSGDIYQVWNKSLCKSDGEYCTGECGVDGC